MLGFSRKYRAFVRNLLLIGQLKPCSGVLPEPKGGYHLKLPIIIR